MKKTLACLALMASLTFLVQGAFAEGTVRLPIQVPFDFFVNNTLLPAGNYTVEVTPSGATQAFSLLVLHNENGQADMGLFVRNQVDKSLDTASLQFSRFDKSYFLTTVSTGRRSVNVEAGKAYREMLAQSKMPSTILISQK